MAKKATTTAKVPAKVDNANPLGSAIVAMPKAGALSLDAGILALRHLAAFADDEQMIGELRSGLESHRGKAQVILAQAVYKAAVADKAIDLSVSLQSDKTHKKEKTILGKQVRLAMGLMVTDGKKTVLTPEADALQNEQPGDDAKTLKRKQSIRSNFSTMLTKSMRVALHAIENNLVMTEENGYLRLTDSKKSGGKMLKHFGAASVLLNEDQNAPVVDKKGKPTGLVKPLKVLPSFTEIMRDVGKAHGIDIVPRKDSRVKAVDPISHLVEVAENLLKAVNNLPADVPEAARKALDALRNAIEEKID
jgi:hypothetical protein